MDLEWGLTYNTYKSYLKFHCYSLLVLTSNQQPVKIGQASCLMYIAGK